MSRKEDEQESENDVAPTKAGEEPVGDVEAEAEYFSFFESPPSS